MYDREGVCGFRYYNGSKWSTYTYLKNALGDVRFIKDNNGNCLVKYSYDPFGNVTAEALGEGGEELAELNPIRYRGYYYDAESGLYYLLTRYYDPAVGQFISPDSFEYLDPHTVGGIDLYAYCSGNPVMYTDPYGTTEWWEWLLGCLVVVGLAAAAVVTGGAAAAAFAGAAVGAGISYSSQAVSGELNWGQFALDAGMGAVSGLIGASGISRLGATVMNGALSGASGIASDALNGRQSTVLGVVTDVLLGGVWGFAGGAGVNNARNLAGNIFTKAKNHIDDITLSLAKAFNQNPNGQLLSIKGGMLAKSIRWLLTGTFVNALIGRLIQ